MLKKILNTPLLVIVLAVLIVGIILFGLSILTSGEGSGRTEAIFDNPNYTLLEEKLTDFSKQEWKLSTYKGLDRNIESYSKDKLITDAQQVALKKSLVNKYLLQLKSASEKSCKKDKNLKTINIIKDELKLLEEKEEVKELLQLTNSFKSAYNFFYRIKKYTEVEAYNESRSKGYYKEAEKMKRHHFFAKNNYLMSQCSKGITLVKVLELLDLRFSREDLKTCNCEQLFERNEYYLTECRNNQ